MPSSRRSIRSRSGGSGMPNAACSSSFQPAPTPSTSRPPESRSTAAAIRASRAGWRKVIGLTRAPAGTFSLPSTSEYMEMPSLRRASSLAGLAPAILLAVLVVPALPVAAQAAPQALALTVHVGYHDVIRSGEWMPVSIDVRNSGADFHGSIEIQAQDTASKGILTNI